MHYQRLVLIGYRGTGQSTIGRLLAARLGWEFVDCDEWIEAAAGQSIAAIFAAEGESGFREREAAAIRAACSRPDRVIATGGGAVLRADNRQQLRQQSLIVWLLARPETILRRLTADPTSTQRRPALTDQPALLEIHTLLEQRRPLYESLADIRIDTDDLSPEAAVDAILTTWRGPATCLC